MKSPNQSGWRFVVFILMSWSVVTKVEHRGTLLFLNSYIDDRFGTMSVVAIQKRYFSIGGRLAAFVSIDLEVREIRIPMLAQFEGYH